MKREWIGIAGVLMLAVAASSFAAGDPAAGKARASACAGCHGANGEGKDKYPALAGLGEAQIIQDLKDYKSGKKANGVMKTFASQLNDKDMENVAAYYASLKK